MRLLLSSDAAPGASIADLSQACRRRTLAGLELTLGAEHGHGVDGWLCPPRERADVRRASGKHASVHWLRVPAGTSKAKQLALASEAHRLGAGLLLPSRVADPPLGIRLALVHGSDPAEAQDAARWARRYDAQTCWEVASGTADSNSMEAVLDAAGERLGHVRLLGAGPEAQRSDATEAHPLWSALALRGYAGTVTLAPSPGADLTAWHHWLFKTRGWGCNTAAEKAARRDRAATHHQTTPL